MADTVRVQDEFLGNLVSYLDHRLPNQWVLCLTADHGHTATPGRTGGAALSEPRMQSMLQARFDSDGDSRSLVQIVRPIWAQLNPSEVQQNGVHLDAVSRYVSELTVSQIAKPQTIHPGQGGTKAFDAVFAGALLSHLDCG
jgi:hypothetical protein